ncbi:hypothetical protein evm_013932 [Chilo suppressalis]|nr:hypothetical protein evm_013932 [Chilo suppressalis]
MDKLKTVEADPLYDYKDMWWKTMRRIPSTKPAVIKNKDNKTITKETFAIRTKTGFIKRISDIPRGNIGVKTKATKAYRPYDTTRKSQQEALMTKNIYLLRDVKPMNAVDVSVLRHSSVGNTTKHNIVIEDYVYSDFLFKRNLTNKDPLKDILLTNDSKVISDIQAEDVTNLINIYNGSKNVMENIAGVNATNLLDYYNFTAQQFGDTALQNQSHLLFEDYETKSTWRLIKAGHTEWLHPTEQHPYSTEPIYTTATVHDETDEKFVVPWQIKKGDRRAGSYIGQRISLAIQRGNAASIFGTLPKGTPFNNVY